MLPMCCIEKNIEVEKIRANFSPKRNVTLNMKLNFETELGRDTLVHFESKCTLVMLQAPEPARLSSNRVSINALDRMDKYEAIKWKLHLL